MTFLTKFSGEEQIKAHLRSKDSFDSAYTGLLTRRIACSC